MKIFGDRNRDLHRMGIAFVPVGRDNDRARYRAFGDAGDQKPVRADYDRSFEIAEPYFRPEEFGRAQPGARNPDFPPRKSGGGRNRVNVRTTINVFSAEDAFGKSHELSSTTSRPASSHSQAVIILIDEKSGGEFALVRERKFQRQHHPVQFRFPQEDVPAGAPEEA